MGTATLERVCSWCPGAKEETERLIARGFKVTHTICDSCRKEYFDEADRSSTCDATQGR